MALRETTDSPVIDYKTHSKGRAMKKKTHTDKHTMRERDVSKEGVSAPCTIMAPFSGEVKKHKLRMPVRRKDQHKKRKASVGAPPVDILELLGFSGPAVGEVGEGDCAYV